MLNNNIIKKQLGFTLLELVLVIVIISILSLFAIDRMFSIRAAAERAVIKQMVGTIKSGLGIEVARLALAGNMPAVSKLNKTNPIYLLSQSPENYLGEKENGDHINEAGIWYFDKKLKSLVYNIAYTEDFTTSLKGTPRVRYQIKLIYHDQNNNKRFDLRSDSIAGLDFVPLEKFSWNVKTTVIARK